MQASASIGGRKRESSSAILFMPRLLRRLGRLQFQLLLILGAALIAARVALPYFVKKYVNQKINEMPGYGGSIGDVDIHLWRGAYTIHEIDIVKTDGKVPVPFFAAPAIDFSVEWRALFQGSLVAKIEFDRPVINFVAGPTEETTQVGVDKPWLSVIKELFPLKINRFEVLDGAVHYRDFYSKPKVNQKIDHIHMLATNLTNSSKLAKTLVATIEITARAFDSGKLGSTIHLDPRPDKPTFDLAATLSPVPLTNFNDFAEAYAFFHFTKGTFTLAMELAASDGKLDGYVKPLLDDMAIIDVRDIKNPVKFTWSALVAGVSRLFRNQPNNRFATKIPISGTFHDPKIGVLPTIGGIFRNEFIRVFQGNLEGSVNLNTARQAEPPKEAPKKANEEKKSTPTRPLIPTLGKPLIPPTKAR